MTMRKCRPFWPAPREKSLFPNDEIKHKWNDIFESSPFKKAKYPKFYKHFDRPISKSKASSLVTSPERIKKNAFLPFMFYEKKFRRYKGKRNRLRLKKRPIMYAGHKDGLIYAYYTMLLSELYEKKIKSLDISNCITAYRAGIGNNIQFAKDVFDEIHDRKNCVAIAIDISSFFDHIDHHNLKQEWCSLLGVSRMPEDHFSVFKSITKWARVDRDKCYEKLCINKNNVPSPVCSPEKFSTEIRKNGLISTNKESFGIPQGSPISAFLANLYMMQFDLEMNSLAENIGGYYRRYSDDILWICNKGEEKSILSSLDNALSKRGETLKRSHDKTDVFTFHINDEGQQVCFNDLNNKRNYQKPLQYLGFTFDGKRTLIRSQTLGKYHRRIRYAVRAAKRVAKKKEYKTIYRKSLNNKLTHLGKKNFITTYAKNAYDHMKDKAIKKQISGNYERVTFELNKVGKRK